MQDLLSDPSMLLFDLEQQSKDSLLDLVLTTEFLSICYQANIELPPIIEPLLQKMDRLTLNQNFSRLNSELELFTRRESGIFESISNLMQIALSVET